MDATNKNIRMKPKQIENGEWYYKGCFIQKQTHPLLLKYHVFKDTEAQETISTCSTLKEAISLCDANEVETPFLGINSFLV